MAIRSIKNRSRGKHNIVLVDYKKHLTTSSPEKHLTKNIHNESGRNNRGVITTRHHGGKHKRRYRFVDFKRSIKDVPAIVKTIEYDPNRTSFVCLICYKNGTKSYILAPRDIKVGDEIICSENAEIKVGNCLRIKNIPEGIFVHNVELTPNHGGQIARSAGVSLQILGKDETGNFTVTKMPSGEIRKIPNDCFATVGMMSNEDHNIINLGKAGKSRYLGKRPHVRGSAMNPIDHPHGGGEGRQGVGRKASYTPWGKRHMGVKTRAKKNKSNMFIIKRRNNK